MKALTAFLLLIALYGGLAAEMADAADPASGTYRNKVVGLPEGTGKMVIEVTLVLGGKKVPKTVTIPSGDIKAFVKPNRKPGESDPDYAQDIADAMGAASYAKAQVICDAINTAFQGEFNKLPDKGASAKATPAFVVEKVNKVTNKTITLGGQGYPTLTALFGQYVVPNISKEKGKDKTGKEILVPGIKFTEGRILGEGGNEGRFDPTPGKPASPGVRASFEHAAPGVATVATGIDPMGDSALVEFGIDGQYVAQYTPAAGQTDDDILSILEAMLDQNGLPASFDPLLGMLALDAPLPDGESLVWGNTDTGLEFTTFFAGLDEFTVPEAPTATLVAIGLFAWSLAVPGFWRRGRAVVSGPRVGPRSGG